MHNYKVAFIKIINNLFMLLQDSSVVLADSFNNLWSGVITFIPNIVVAIVIFVVGWIIASLIGGVIEQVFKTIKVDGALRKAGLEEAVAKAGLVLDSGKFVGGLVKWFVIVVFLIASFDVLHLTQVNEFLKGVVIDYLPQVIASVLILLVTAVIADAVQKIVASSTKAAGVRSANLLASIAKWVIWIGGILAAISQLGIAEAIIQTVFTGVVVALSIAFGLAFGLGGQQAASDIISKVRSEISDRQR